MAVSVAECHAMIATADAHGVKLMVGHKRRLRPAFATMGQVLRSGVLGNVQVLTVTRYHDRELHGWWARTIGSRRTDVLGGVHDVDTLRFLCGEVESVYAVAGPRRTPIPTTPIASAPSSTSARVRSVRSRSVRTIRCASIARRLASRSCASGAA